MTRLTEDELDERFGSLRDPAFVDDWERNTSPQSLTEWGGGCAETLTDFLDSAQSQLLRHSAKSKTFIWAVDATGQLHVAVEELAPSAYTVNRRGIPRRRRVKHGSEEQKLGHPCLLKGGKARIAGELFVDDMGGSAAWYLNASSGRYCAELKPSFDQVRNVAKVLKQAGLDVELDADYLF